MHDLQLAAAIIYAKIVILFQIVSMIIFVWSYGLEKLLIFGQNVIQELFQ
jgi:hypothetical protein